MADDDSSSGFGEAAQAVFDYTEIATLANRLMEQYRFRCAVSGADISNKNLEPTVFFLQPLEHGGRIHPENAVLVERASGRLLQSGLVLISDAFETFIARADLMDSSARSLPNGGRKLFLPDSAEFWPSTAMIAYHRSLFRAQ